MNKALIGTVTLLAASQFSWAGILFDDFNTDKGHLGYAPGFSGTTTFIDKVNSTSVRDTSGSAFEGLGAMKLDLIHDTSSSAARVRWVSGAAPYGTAQAGVPSYNTSFTTTSGEDGYIGFYAKTDASGSGWTVSLNLDGPANSAADMDGSTALNLIADGQWHLYEWNLDGNTWGSVSGIGGGHTGGTLVNTAHTIDSIYFRGGTTPSATATIYVDFVAKSDSGSIASMTAVPEPSALALSLLGGFALAARVVARRRNA